MDRFCSLIDYLTMQSDCRDGLIDRLIGFEMKQCTHYLDCRDGSIDGLTMLFD